MCGGRKWLGFSVWIEVNMFFVSVHHCWLEFSVGIEIDLILVVGRKNFNLFSCGGSNFTSYFTGGQNCLDFSVGDWTLLDFSVLIKIDLVLCWGRKLIGFRVRIEISLAVVWSHRNLLDDKVGTDFISVGATKFIRLFVWGIDFVFFLVFESMLTRFLCGGSKLIVC